MIGLIIIIIIIIIIGYVFTAINIIIIITRAQCSVSQTECHSFLNIQMWIWSPLPSLVFGLVATLTGLLYLLLPETLGRPLPNTVQQAEKMAVGSGCAIRTANT